MKEIVVLGDVYEVDFVNTPEDMKVEMGKWGKMEDGDELQILGVCLPLSNEIKILKNLTPDEETITPVPTKALKKVLLHEVVHAYFEVLNPEISENEELVDQIATMLYHMNIDGNFNAKLFDAVKE